MNNAFPFLGPVRGQYKSCREQPTNNGWAYPSRAGVSCHAYWFVHGNDIRVFVQHN